MGDMQKDELAPLTSGSPKSSFNADEPPMVFQCAQCNVIVGDSAAWVCVDDISRTITLRNLTNAVMQEEDLKTASTGFDAGSTYYTMSCATCQEEIGRKYKGAVNHLDPARGLYTLFVDKLSSYQIGSYCKEITDTADMSDILSMAKVRDMNIQLSRFGAMMQEISDRLHALEQRYPSQGGEDNLSVKSLSYPSSSWTSVPSQCRTPSHPSRFSFTNNQLPDTNNHKNEPMFKTPQVRHMMQHQSFNESYAESVPSTYSHLEQLHKNEKREHPLDNELAESFQSHANNYPRNVPCNNARQQRRNSLNVENQQRRETLPQNLRRRMSTQMYEGERELSPKHWNGDSRDNMDTVKTSKSMQSATRANTKRKEVSPSGPLQAMMNRRQKRRI